MKNPAFFYLAIATLLLSACTGNTDTSAVLNNKASLPPAFNFDSLGLQFMSSSVNKNLQTMSVIYANPLGFKVAANQLKEHFGGEVLALVTWRQQRDEHWFGGKIPGELKTIELVKTTNNDTGIDVRYQRFDGKNLVVNKDTTNRQQRIAYILSQQPSVMP